MRSILQDIHGPLTKRGWVRLDIGQVLFAYFLTETESSSVNTEKKKNDANNQ